MIVCDKCKKPLFYGASLELLLHEHVYPEDVEKKYDFCDSCMQELLKNIRVFINQGKFNGELEGGSNG